MCQQQPGLNLAHPLTLLIATTLSLAACAHYDWGTTPPEDGSDSPSKTPDGPSVSTVDAPPDWSLDGNQLANVTVRALHRHGAPRASRLSTSQKTNRVSCRLLGERPTGFGRHHLARVLARCHWHRGPDHPDIHASGSGHTATSSDQPGDPQTSSLRQTALRTASRQALARTAANLMATWHQRHR
jgi:hypothetical protein